MKKKILKNIEWGIFICCIILLIIGLVALFSSTNDSDHDEFKKQILWSAVSIPIVMIVIFIDYNLIAKVSPCFYGIFLVLLVGVLFTPEVNGAHSWFKLNETLAFQPSEFAKIFVVIFLARVIVNMQKKGKKEINKIWKLALLLIIVGVPLSLILIQPDLGTATAFIIATVAMLFVAGIDKKYIIVCTLLVVISVPVIYMFVLPEHAKSRIDVYLNPNIDPRGAGYNVIQSKLAIGAGQLLGMGVLKGNQTQLGYLYPKTTDFIFSVIGEEMGFVISSLIIVVYVFLINKAVYVSKTAKDDLGSYIAIGIVGIFFFHMIENIGMTMGLLPITGVPLPFVSYGGSSLVTNFICIGLLLNISGRRQKTIFVD